MHFRRLQSYTFRASHFSFGFSMSFSNCSMRRSLLWTVAPFSHVSFLISAHPLVSCFVCAHPQVSFHCLDETCVAPQAISRYLVEPNLRTLTRQHVNHRHSCFLVLVDMDQIDWDSVYEFLNGESAPPYIIGNNSTSTCAPVDSDSG